MCLGVSVRGGQEIAEKVRKEGKVYVKQRLSQSKEKTAQPKSTVKRARVIPLNDDDSGMRPEHSVQVRTECHSACAAIGAPIKRSAKLGGGADQWGAETGALRRTVAQRRRGPGGGHQGKRAAAYES